MSFIALLLSLGLAFESTPGAEIQNNFQQQYQSATQASEAELLHYQQKQYAAVDPFGDYALAALALKIRNHLPAWLLQIEKYNDFLGPTLKMERNEQCEILPQECSGEKLNSVSASATASFGVSDHHPLNEIELLAKFYSIIREAEKENHIFFYEGITHEWSGVFQANYFHPLEPDPLDVGYPKLLMALTFGVSSRFMITEKELPLLKKILQQPLNSISLEWMFRESYLLNQGSVYNTLLTIENVLSRFYTHPDRESLPVTRRLIAIDKLVEIPGWNNKDNGLGNDKFGTWYHFWGLVLYGFYSERRKDIYSPLSAAEFETNLAGIISSGRPPAKDILNLVGARAGINLKHLVQSLKQSP